MTATILTDPAVIAIAKELSDTFKRFDNLAVCLNDVLALRMLHQDVCVKSDYYVKNISFDRVPVLGRCPEVQL
jgi:hypothetical protein